MQDHSTPGHPQGKEPRRSMPEEQRAKLRATWTPERKAHYASLFSKSWEEVFWPRVKKTDGCWWWTGKPNSSGYGQCRSKGRSLRAHRLSWILANGPIPEGMCVCHICDEGLPPGDISYRLCVNPAHLFIGTNADNRRDAVNKGRMGKGIWHIPEDARMRMSETHKGVPKSPETRAKMSANFNNRMSFAGRKHTEETKQRLSERFKGQPGNKWTEMQRQKMIAALKGRPKSAETRQRMRAAAQLRWRNRDGQFVAERDIQ